MTNSTTLVGNALHYKPEWYRIGDADNNWIAALYGLIAIASIWRLEDLADLWLVRKKDHVSLSDVAAQATFQGSNFWEVIKWIFTRPTGTRFSRKASFGVALRVLIYVVEFLILFGSIPQTNAVFENQVPGSSEISFEKGRVGVSNETRRVSLRLDPFNLKWCAADKVEFLGFTPTAARLVCMVTERNLGTIRLGQEILDFLPPETRSSSRFSATLSEFYYIVYNNNTASLEIQGLRSGTKYIYTHTLSYRNGFEGQRPITDHARFGMPRNIRDQALSYVLAHQETFRCEEIPLGRNSLPFKVVFCEFQEYTALEASIVPEVLLLGIGTIRVSKPREKFTGYINGTTRIFEHTNFMLGEVNRPRLCLIPSLIILVILSALSLVPRIWISGGNITLQLWMWFSATLDSCNSENPLYVTKEKENGKVNIFDIEKSDVSDREQAN